MGLQDRDYYWERHRKNNGSFSIQTRRKGSSIKYLLYSIVTIGALWYAYDVLLKSRVLNKKTPGSGLELRIFTTSFVIRDLAPCFLCFLNFTVMSEGKISGLFFTLRLKLS